MTAQTLEWLLENTGFHLKICGPFIYVRNFESRPIYLALSMRQVEDFLVNRIAKYN